MVFNETINTNHWGNRKSINKFWKQSYQKELQEELKCILICVHIELLNSYLLNCIAKIHCKKRCATQSGHLTKV